MDFPPIGSWIKVGFASSVGGAGRTGKKEHFINGQLFSKDSSFCSIVWPIIPSDYSSIPPPLRAPIQHGVHVCRVTEISSIEQIPTPSTALELPISLPLIRPIRQDRLIRKDQKTSRARQADFGARPPEGVSAEAMAIFTSLSKTLPCHWYRGKEAKEAIIVVMNEVFISAPYIPSTVTGGSPTTDAALLDRIKMVLVCERKRLFQ